MVKKQDRFDRMVLAELKRREHGPGDPCIWLIGPEVVELLRRYHREVVELVKQQRVVPEQGDSWDNGYNEAVEDLLVELEELAK